MKRDLLTRIVHEALAPRVLDNGASTQLLDRELIEGDGGDSAFVSDFEHAEDLRERALIGPDGQILDDLDHAVHVRHLEKEEANERAPHTCVNPPSWDGGVGGGEVALIPAQNTANQSTLQRIAFWNGDERETQPVLITFGLQELPTPAGSTGVIRPFARVTWGNRGKHIIDLDIHRGTQIVVGGSAVAVDVGLDGGSDTGVTVFCSLAYWSGEKIAAATRTAYVGTLVHGAGASAAQNRPNYAATIAAVHRANATVPFTLAMLDLNNNTIGQVTVAASTFITAPIPLPNDCAAVTLANTDAANDTAFRLVWGLDR